MKEPVTPRMEVDIEEMFLSSLLRIALVGVSIILTTDVLIYPADRLSLVIDVAILAGCSVAYAIRKRTPRISSAIVISVLSATMFYQSVWVPLNTTTSFSVILIVGFLISIFMKGSTMWIFHGVILAGINAVYIYQGLAPEVAGGKHPADILTIQITYSILYFVISYATWVLKKNYDHAHGALRQANLDLHAKADEVEAQNEELIQIQENLNDINRDLERKVAERTEGLREKTERLIRYSYSNAHHLRGPVARLLGLVAVRDLDGNPDDTFFFAAVKKQAEEIDRVVKQINDELEDL